MPNTIAIITARGGSKRIPKKNIKDFFGKPIISYAINACKESGIFSEIMVSTDDNEIAEIAKKYGANVPFMRSERTSNDIAITYDVLEEVLTNYKNIGKEYDYVCCVFPCVPFLTGITLKDAYNKFISADTDSLQPVCKYSVPVDWALDIDNNGIIVPVNRDILSVRSQDIPPKYFDAGMFYLYKTTALLSEKKQTPVNTLAYIMNENEVQDIDTMEDWTMAELKYKLILEKTVINEQ